MTPTHPESELVALLATLRDSILHSSVADGERPGLLDELGALEAAITRAATVPQGVWLPIESAPKDGTNVLLVHVSEKSPNSVTQGYWLDAEEDGIDYMGADAGFVDVHYTVFYRGRSFGQQAFQGPGHQPTHWQPLPTPPPAELGKGA